MSDAGREERRALEAHHRPEAVRERVEGHDLEDYLGDAVLGAVDGGITSFAVVAGATGGGFSNLVVVVLGFASLLADGFSMAVSNYLGSHSERERARQLRRREERHARIDPAGQREELRQILIAKGVDESVLDDVVGALTRDRRLWAEMVAGETSGASGGLASPALAATATFVAFVLIGAVPLLPFLAIGVETRTAFAASAAATAMAFLVVGVIKARVLAGGILRSALETLLLGGTAALLAYAAGAVLRRAFDA